MIRQLGWACVVYGVVGTACDSGSLPNADDAGFDTDWDGGYGDAADAKADTDDDRKNACLEEGYAYHDKTSTCYVPDSVDYQVWSPGDLAASPYVEFCGALNAYDARCKEAWTPCNVLGGDTILCRYLYDELDYRLCLGAPRPEGWGPDEDDNLIDWPSDDLRWPPSYDDPPAWAPYRHWRASFRTAVTD
ncbi:MAG: hypothetical protein KC417_16930, partial [Myxococcales bacterium]|nr:hypothetical protein [Myxococcales bacterium]